MELLDSLKIYFGTLNTLKNKIIGYHKKYFGNFGHPKKLKIFIFKVLYVPEGKENRYTSSKTSSSKLRISSNSVSDNPLLLAVM